MIKINFSKKEKIFFVISVLVLTFAFGFNDKRPTFDPSYYLLNMLRIFFLVAISLILIETTIRIAAKWYGAKAEYELWGIRRFAFARQSKLRKKIPLGILLAIIVAFVSKGSFIFALVQNHTLKENTQLRAIRKFKYLTEFETALIYSIVPITAVFAICIAKIFGIQDLVTINSYLALFLVIPFPASDAIKLLFSAKFFYLFVLIFVIISVILLSLSSIIPSIIIAILVAFIFLIFSLFKTYI